MSPFDGPQDRFTKRRYTAEAVLGKGTGPALVRISAFNPHGQGLGSAVVHFDVDQAWQYLEMLAHAIAAAERGEEADPHGRAAREEQRALGRHDRDPLALTRKKFTVHEGGKS